LYYLIRFPDRSGGEREVIGVAGYAGPPTEDGVVEIGYAVAPEHQRRGYATEATAALLSRAFEDPRVRVVAATTFPSLVASIGVLTKTGFAFAGAGEGDGTVRYERRRP
jgi:ribosomal-protein-alanine N-acetyltransferase